MVRGCHAVIRSEPKLMRPLEVGDDDRSGTCSRDTASSEAGPPPPALVALGGSNGSPSSPPVIPNLDTPRLLGVSTGCGRRSRFPAPRKREGPREPEFSFQPFPV